MAAYQMCVNNRQIFDFYAKNPSLDFEQMNLLCIGLFENVLQDAAVGMNKSIGSQILLECLENTAKLNSISVDLNVINMNIAKLSADIFLRLADIKKDYLDEVKNIIGAELLGTCDKIREIMDKNSITSDLKLEKINAGCFDKIVELVSNTGAQAASKTAELLGQIVPDNNAKLAKQFQDDIGVFYASIIKEFAASFSGVADFATNCATAKETQDKIYQLLQANNTGAFEAFSNVFDAKYAALLQNIQQPIIQILSTNDEKLNTNINRQQNTQESMVKLLGDFLNKYTANSSVKGKYSETQLMQLIVQMYPSAQVVDCSKINHSGDIILKRELYDDILFENKDYVANVDIAETNKFINDCETTKMHGIFCSQDSGITGKKNYHIDIKKRKILIYIHHVGYSQFKVQTAVDIIDSLAAKLKDIDDIDEDEDDAIISADMLKEINAEFGRFIALKETIICLVKDSQKKIIDEIKNIQIPTLEAYLNKKNGTVKPVIICDICNVYVAKSNKALASHKRGKTCQQIDVTAVAAVAAPETPPVMLCCEPITKPIKIKIKRVKPTPPTPLTPPLPPLPHPAVSLP